jgi:hypothetical protein
MAIASTAGAQVERAARAFAKHDAVDHFHAAGGGAVVAGAEGETGLDLDGDVADAPRRAVVTAVNEETPGADRLQTFEGACDPVDIVEALAVDRDAPGGRAQRLGGETVVALDIDRQFVEPRRLVELGKGERDALFLEPDAEFGEEPFGFRLRSPQEEARLGHGRSQDAARRLSLASALSGFSP